MKKSNQYKNLVATSKIGAFVICMLLQWQLVHAQQNADTKYTKPLKEVLQDVQKKYGVAIKFVDSMVAGKLVTYADWKYRNDVEQTLDYILKPLELKVKKEGDKKYKLSVYEYFRWNVEEGWAELDRIAAQYNNLEQWEKRKQALVPAIIEALQLKNLPARVANAPIYTTVKKYNGYTIQNIAIEYLPGVWVNGSLYKPDHYKGKLPLVLHPQGHWDKHRYRPDCQFTSAAIAKMGAMVFNYDMFAYGESGLQVNFEDHRKSLSMTLQVLASKRILDYFLGLKDTDTSKVAMAGGSGAGTHTILMGAIDKRIKILAPIVSLSSYFYGGCPCESGMPVHQCLGRTNNVEIAALAAPKPQLVVSDGGDWTDKMPQHDFLYLQKMYGYYNAAPNVTNVHLPNDKHDFGYNKRVPLYHFLADNFGLSTAAIENESKQIVDTAITLETDTSFYVFGSHGQNLPAHAVHGFDNIEKLFYSEIDAAKKNQRYKIGLIDLMLLKRQKLGAITLAAQLNADGVEVDMGGLGNRPTFDNQLLIDSVRNKFITTAKENKVEIFSLAMTGYYAQSFCERQEYIQSIQDCITTMKLMQVKTAFLPLGVQCDLTKNPLVRDSVIARLQVVGKMAKEAGVVIAIETSLSAKEEVKLLTAIHEPAIKIYFNFSNPLKEGRDLIKELKILGKDRIAMIHASNKDSVWLQNDPQIDIKAIKNCLDEIGYTGWLVIERSRDAKKPSDTKYNYGANTAFLKQKFQLQ